MILEKQKKRKREHLRLSRRRRMPQCLLRSQWGQLILFKWRNLRRLVSWFLDLRYACSILLSSSSTVS